MNKHFKKFSAGKGFTIIELLVVIAIIAVLAAIVLVNVTGYINKGKDAAVKGNLSTLLTDAISFYNTNGDYNAVNTDTDYVIAATAITSAGYTTFIDECEGAGGACLDTNANWCASVVLKANTANSYCVDSTGKKVEAATASATCALGVCP